MLHTIGFLMGIDTFHLQKVKMDAKNIIISYPLSTLINILG